MRFFIGPHNSRQVPFAPQCVDKFAQTPRPRQRLRPRRRDRPAAGFGEISTTSPTRHRPKQRLLSRPGRRRWPAAARSGAADRTDTSTTPTNVPAPPAPTTITTKATAQAGLRLDRVEPATTVTRQIDQQQLRLPPRHRPRSRPGLRRRPACYRISCSYPHRHEHDTGSGTDREHDQSDGAGRPAARAGPAGRTGTSTKPDRAPATITAIATTATAPAALLVDLMQLATPARAQHRPRHRPRSRPGQRHRRRSRPSQAPATTTAERRPRPQRRTDYGSYASIPTIPGLNR